MNTKTGILRKDLRKNKWKYIMILPVIIYIAVFCYKPMYGVIIAFKNFRPAVGIMDSPWVGLKHFITFFNDYNFWRILKNTFSISALSILFGFPAPILLALLINEIRNTKFKRAVQTISYMPYFISMVIILWADKNLLSDRRHYYGFGCRPGRGAG